LQENAVSDSDLVLSFSPAVNGLARQTQKPIGLPIGLMRRRDGLDEKFYTGLPGGLMESLGHLTTIENLEGAPNLRHLYAHLVENQFIVDIKNYAAGWLKIYSSEVLAKIHAGDESLAQLIPPQIFEVIKARKLFGWGQKRWRWPRSPTATGIQLLLDNRQRREQCPTHETAR
jgi:hypothetical protein